MELLLPDMRLLFWTVSILIIVLPIVALFSLLKSTFKDSTTKLIWALVILLMPVIGSIFYFIIGRRQRVKVT
ncbi:MAG: PLDc N-terminal domain-containing protein [Chitinophagaceae bacterium]|nr:PLDc N-terminal domain-containing protein [Chitinophagaceae bacterium]